MEQKVRRTEKLTRRQLLKLSVGAGFSANSLQTLGPGQTRPGSAGRPTKVAIFLPGIMGSVLRVHSNTGPVDLWTENSSQIYGTLVDSPNVLRYSGNAATADGILESINNPIGLKETVFYTRLIELLRSSSALRLLRLPYDWREGINTVLSRLKPQLNDLVAGNTKGAPVDEYYVIGHSMGALIGLLAVARGLIPAERVRLLALIAPPLGGSPKAFRSLIQCEFLPFLGPILSVWYRKRRDEACANLLDVARSFPSMYELMPPESKHYVYELGINEWTNPLTSGFLNTAHAGTAKGLHDEILQTIRQLPLGPDRFHIMFGDSHQTDIHYYAERRTGEPGPAYKIVTALPLEHGDGTVWRESAVYYQKLVGRVTPHRFLFEQHATMCNSTKVLEVLRTLL